MTIADLAQTVQTAPNQVFADLLLGLPLTLFVVLVLLFPAAARRGRRTWR